MVTGVEAATGEVVTVKLALVDPAGTVTEAGTVAAAVSLLVRLTGIPPAGAGPVSVTVPVELVPPCTDAGLRLIELKAGGVTVSTAVREVPL